MGKRRAERHTVDASRYEILFADGRSDTGAVGPGWIRTKTTKAGDMLDVESYPMIVSAEVRRTVDVAKKKRHTCGTGKSKCRA